MRSVDGGQCQVREYTKDVSQATAIFIHDLVTREADGNIAPGGTPGTTLILGASLNHGAALTLSTHLVIISPGAIYEAQDNNDTDGVAAADLGQNSNVEYNTGGALTLLSGHEIDESSLNTTSTLDLKLLGLLTVPDNAHGANARIEVMINKHQLGQGVAGI